MDAQTLAAGKTVIMIESDDVIVHYATGEVSEWLQERIPRDDDTGSHVGTTADLSADDLALIREAADLSLAQRAAKRAAEEEQHQREIEARRREESLPPKEIERQAKDIRREIKGTRIVETRIGTCYQPPANNEWMDAHCTVHTVEDGLDREITVHVPMPGMERRIYQAATKAATKTVSSGISDEGRAWTSTRKVRVPRWV